MPLVCAQALDKSYAMGGDVVHALRNVSLDIADGDFVAIMGTSGSGKSTLMNILGCLDTPTAGTYTLAGEAVQNMDADALALIRNQRIGFVFQQFNLLSRASALENVALPLVYAGVAAQQRRERATAALQRVGLSERMHHTPAELSGGQQQRVAIARALVNQPQLILADEPTGALDSQTSEEVMQLLTDLNTQGITVVLVTHEVDIAAWARRKIVFKDGQIVEDMRRVSDILHPAAVRDGQSRSGTAQMNTAAALRSAWRALASNALRSLLTMLGIVIGVAAVITMVAVGRGATDRVQEQMKGLGSNIMLVLPGGATAAGVRQGAQTRSRLTEEDATAIQVEVPEVQVAAPSSRTTAQVVANNTNWSTTIFGTNNGYLEAREWPLAAGRMFEEAELQGSAKVGLIGTTVAQELFGDADPIDQIVRIRTVPVKIVGVLGRKGQNSMGQDQDDIVVLPISTYRNRLQGGSPGNVKRVWAINVKVREGQSMQVAEDNIRELLRQRFKVETSADDTFTIRNLSEILEAQEQSSRTMTLLLAAVAGISLLIGGIGIMNIMLVSVTERTREIGLRMAVGARGRDILVQFLIEAVTLSLLGGAAGVLLGAATTWSVGQWAGWQVSMTTASIALAVGFSAAVGIFFGFYPARRASLLQPITALRHA